MEIERQNYEFAKNLIITRNTLKKIHEYSRLVCELGDIECYGFLLNPKNKKDNIAYNAILACDQIVSGGSADIGPEGAFKSKAEIENLGYDAIGCWHSHHHMGAWHSGTDNKNLEKLVSSIAGNREIILAERDTLKNDFERNRLLIRENGTEIEITSPTNIAYYLTERKTFNPKINYMHTTDNKLFLRIGEKVISLPLEEHTISYKKAIPEKIRSMGYAYSLVVSDGKNYSEVALKEICSACQKSHVEKRPVELKIIEPMDDISFTERGLKQEIKEKIRKPGLLSIFR